MVAVSLSKTGQIIYCTVKFISKFRFSSLLLYKKIVINGNIKILWNSVAIFLCILGLKRVLIWYFFSICCYEKE